MGQVQGLLAQPLTHEWSTPQAFFDRLDQEFRFTVDAAANDENHKCARWFGLGGEQINGLAVSWAGESVWCNPPYGRYIGEWVRKGYEESQQGAFVVMLIPARTETAWWHDYVMQATEIRFVRGRLRFSGFTVNAPFPSAVVIFSDIVSSVLAEHPIVRSIER